MQQRWIFPTGTCPVLLNADKNTVTVLGHKNSGTLEGSDRPSATKLAKPDLQGNPGPKAKPGIS
jgi:hypothetical protein